MRRAFFELGALFFFFFVVAQTHELRGMHLDSVGSQIELEAPRLNLSSTFFEKLELP